MFEGRGQTLHEDRGMPAFLGILPVDNGYDRRGRCGFKDWEDSHGVDSPSVEIPKLRWRSIGNGRDVRKRAVSDRTKSDRRIGVGSPGVIPQGLEPDRQRSEERRVGKEGRSRWAPYH